jgi:hypothetical protein
VPCRAVIRYLAKRNSIDDAKVGLTLNRISTDRRVIALPGLTGGMSTLSQIGHARAAEQGL